MIKSSITVKSSVPLEPIKFKKLVNGTIIHDVPNVQEATKGFDSFRLALQFPECLEDVDIISNAENIKKLLKLPEVPNSIISMVVHKVGNSLLLDEFGSSKIQSNKDWELFQPFIKLQSEKSSCTNQEYVKFNESNRDTIGDDNEYQSDFFYQSTERFDVSGLYRYDAIEYNATKSIKLCGTLLPDPSFEITIPLANHGHSFRRNVVWNFDEFKMLIGSNMPIFETFRSPKVSLKLNDMSTPFTKATGKDYWLDNMMSDLHEVVICHHKNGVVQNYETIRTTDLPSKVCKFSVQIVQNVTQNIIHGLKKCATKFGHTYWLFKGKDDINLKLYDLTALCSKGNEMPQSLFTVPIAMLNYIYAKNIMSVPGEISVEKSALAHTHLMHSLKLIPPNKYTEISTSICYILSLLYIPNDCDLNAFQNNETHYTYYKEERIQTAKQQGVTIECIYEKFNENQFSKSSDELLPLFSNTQERCNQALMYVATAIKQLKCFNFDEITVKKSEPCAKEQDIDINLQEEEDYRNRLRSTILGNNSSVLLLDSFITKKLQSWKTHLRFLLIQKACVIYAMKCRHEYIQKTYGNSLNFVYMALRCQQLIRSFSTFAFQNSFLFCWAADCFQTIVLNFENLDTYLTQYHELTDVDKFFYDELRLNLGIEMNQYIEEPVNDFGTLVDSCVKMYENALNCSSPERRDSYFVRLGHEYNNLDHYDAHMQSSLNKDQKNIIDINYIKILDKSHDAISRGIQILHEQQNAKGVALLLCNKGFVWVNRARIHLRFEAPEDLDFLQKFYEESFGCYELAKTVLGSRNYYMDLWDTVHWDYCKACLSLGGFIQDNCPRVNSITLNHRKKAIELLIRALELSIFGFNDRKQFVYSKGLIHSRLAAYQYEEIIYAMNNSIAVETMQQICEFHYKQALYFFDSIKQTDECIELLIQRVELHDFITFSTENINLKMSYLMVALDACLESYTLFHYIGFSGIDINCKNGLLDKIFYFETRLQSILCKIIKISVMRKDSYNDRVRIFEEMYFYSINTIVFSDVYSFSRYFSKVLNKLIELYNNVLR